MGGGETRIYCGVWGYLPVSDSINWFTGLPCKYFSFFEYNKPYFTLREEEKSPLSLLWTIFYVERGGEAAIFSLLNHILCWERRRSRHVPSSEPHFMLREEEKPPLSLLWTTFYVKRGGEAETFSPLNHEEEKPPHSLLWTTTSVYPVYTLFIHVCPEKKKKINFMHLVFSL